MARQRAESVIAGRKNGLSIKSVDNSGGLGMLMVGLLSTAKSERVSWSLYCHWRGCLGIWLTFVEEHLHFRIICLSRERQVEEWIDSQGSDIRIHIDLGVEIGIRLYVCRLFQSLKR
jgi:hypothetical protein